VQKTEVLTTFFCIAVFSIKCENDKGIEFKVLLMLKLNHINNKKILHLNRKEVHYLD